MPGEASEAPIAGWCPGQGSVQVAPAAGRCVPADVIGTRIAAASAAILLAGCSAAPASHAVFGGTRGGDPGDFISGIVLAGQHYIYGIMIPDLHNYTSRSVRLTSVRLISPHRPAIRVLSVTAYRGATSLTAPHSSTRAT